MLQMPGIFSHVILDWPKKTEEILWWDDSYVDVLRQHPANMAKGKEEYSLQEQDFSWCPSPTLDDPFSLFLSLSSARLPLWCRENSSFLLA